MEQSVTCLRRVQQTMEAVRWQLAVSFHDSEVKDSVSSNMQTSWEREKTNKFTENVCSDVLNPAWRASNRPRVSWGTSPARSGLLGRTRAALNPSSCLRLQEHVSSRKSWHYSSETQNNQNFTLTTIFLLACCRFSHFFGDTAHVLRKKKAGIMTIRTQLISSQSKSWSGRNETLFQSSHNSLCLWVFLIVKDFKCLFHIKK